MAYNNLKAAAFNIHELNSSHLRFGVYFEKSTSFDNFTDPFQFRFFFFN